MEIRIGEINQVGYDTGYVPDQEAREQASIRPVQKTEGNNSRKVARDEQEAAKQTPWEEKPSESELEELSEELNSHLDSLNLQFEYSVDDDTGDYVVKVLNKDDGEMIRQIPPEQALKLRAKLNELKGILFSDKA